MRKSAQTFLRRAPVATHAMRRARRRRDEAHRATATRPALTSSPRQNAGDHLAHLHAMPPPTASRACIDRHGSHRSPAGAGTHRSGALRRRARRMPRRRCLFLAPHTAPHLRRVGKPAAPGVRAHASDAATRGNHAALAVQPGDNLTPSSHQRTPRRQRHGLSQRPCEEGGAEADDGGAAWRPKRNRPHWAAGSGVATGRSAQWPSSSSSSAYSSGESSSFNCSASSASSTRIQPSP